MSAGGVRSSEMARVFNPCDVGGAQAIRRTRGFGLRSLLRVPYS